MESFIKITDDKSEIVALGRQIVAENPVRYSDAMMRELADKYGEFFPDEEAFKANLYSAIYCQVLYGTTIIEYLYYDFERRSHVEKSGYVTWFNRYAYLSHLNNVKDVHLLDNKFEAYERLRPFYRREAMLLSDGRDYAAFCAFAGRHRTIYVKPVNLDLSEGAHRMDVGEKVDRRVVFETLLAEARNLHSDAVRRKVLPQLILEEEIVPSEAITHFNPFDMSVLRVPTVLVDGKVQFFHPCIRLKYGDGKDRFGEKYSLVALIDADTGVIVTGGRLELREEQSIHPVSRARIRGFQMPEWHSLRDMLTRAALQFPTIRYVGWDVVHTDGGWCIIEGNPGGEFFFQQCVGHGVRDEFEKLIGFRFRMPAGLRWDVLLKDKENRGYL